MSENMSIEQFLKKATELSEKGAVIKKFDEALKKGYAQTPKTKDSPYSYEDTQAIIQIVVECCYGYWNTHHKLIRVTHLADLVKERIAELKAIGMWNRHIPGHNSRERCVNHAADKRSFPDKKPKLISPKRGYYCPNPIFFEEECRQQLLKVIEEFKTKKVS